MLAVVAIAVCAAIAAWALAKAQGGGAPAAASFGEHAVPVIEAATWLDAVEAEGRTVASERMFQMDLMRRSAAGRLAEWFGEKAVVLDRRRKAEDWEGVAAAAYAALPEDEKQHVDRYAAGVNAFIADRTRRWGLEYLALRVQPEPWTGADTMLVLLSMAEQLTSSSPDDAIRGRWRDAIGEPWTSFLFPEDHPWNEPMFGTRTSTGPALPLSRPLPRAPISAAERKAAGAPPIELDEAEIGGSNNWAWCGATGCFLCNDPHLGASVPQLWYAVSLKVGAEQVTGVSLPGIPGVVLGMSSHLAWAFTNVGEDVDDLLAETLSDDGATYLANERGERHPLEVRRHTIRVKDGADVVVESRHTHRGPLVDTGDLLPGTWSRQWLPLKPGMLRLPTGVLRATSFEEMNRALDGMKVPAQNVLVVEKSGGIGYRTSGTGVVRRPGSGGRWPMPAVSGEWLGVEPPSERPRLWLAASSTGARFLATANERIWIDEGRGHMWADDNRKDRIRTVLRSRADFTQRDMERLQLDTYSRYHVLLRDWIAARARATSTGEQRVLERWARWDGRAESDAATFTELLAAGDKLQDLLVGRVRRALLPEELRELPYAHRLARAWLLATLATHDGLAVFGLEEGEVAELLLASAAARAASGKPSYAEENAWKAQHPFVGRVPILGGLFAVPESPQVGYNGVVRVERPKFGASVRMVWNLRDPHASTWSFPVGQSGHPLSRHYQDLLPLWRSGQYFPVFGN